MMKEEHKKHQFLYWFNSTESTSNL